MLPLILVYIELSIMIRSEEDSKLKVAEPDSTMSESTQPDQGWDQEVPGTLPKEKVEDYSNDFFFCHECC